MKTKLIFLISCLALVAGGCKKEAFELPEALVKAKSDLTAEFDQLTQKMAAAEVYLLSINMDTALIRAKLLEMVTSSSDITDIAWVTPAGIMQIIEPSVYYGSQGADISRQDHVIKAFETKLPVLSQTFLSVEGFYAAVVMRPIIRNGSISGGIAALFYPEQILGNVLKPIFEGKDFELWVMEKGGRILYDQDEPWIGRNLFTDSPYAGFPELVAAGRKIEAEENGTTTYSFLKTGTTETVTKLAYWDSFMLYGNEWKVVWIRVEE